MNKHAGKQAVRRLPIYMTALLTLALLLHAAQATAAATDIAPAPIFTTTAPTTEVKPNVMFVLDDSGSMAWDFLPDSVQDFSASYGYFSSQCNGVYYNPTLTYSPPLYADGSSYPNAAFTAAPDNGYDPKAGSSNLSNSFSTQADGWHGAAYYYVYSGSQTTAKLKNYSDTNSTFYQECNSPVGASPGSRVFSRVTVSSTSGPHNTDERGNFANWYSYYRTRIQTMKTGAGQAFGTLDNHFRVGFMSINDNASPAFLNIADFDSTQKANWYTKLYSSYGLYGTPLREALANTGRLYAGKLSSLKTSTVTDPVQYACQQNYTILSTDGYWNGWDADVKKLDGTTVMDDQDGALPRPYTDGGGLNPNGLIVYTSVRKVQANYQGDITTTTWNRTTTTIGASCTTTGNAAGRLVTSTPYTQVETGIQYGFLETYTVQGHQDAPVVYTNGVPGPPGPLSDWTDDVYLDDGYETPYPATDTCGGQSPPCPSSAGTWTAGTPTVNNVCVANAQLPVAGTSAPTSTVETSDGAFDLKTLSSTPPVISYTNVSTVGAANTLADTAAYYYNTNLRTAALNNCTGPVIPPATQPSNLCAPNKVPPNSSDTATWQHMTTFTLGLGVAGLMAYSPTYQNLSDTSSDYYYVAKGITASDSTCSWRDAATVTGGPCNWPVPIYDELVNVDDLWHAAVNGHGTYFSAGDPNALKQALAGSLNVIINAPRPGTAATASTSNPRITSANNFQFSAYFASVEWSGDIIKQTIDLSNGSVASYNPGAPDPSSYVWSARDLLDVKNYAKRNIYTNIGGTLTVFDWPSMGSSAQNSFKTAAITTATPSYPAPLTGLSQFCATGTGCISATAQGNSTAATGGAAGEALVNFLRGDRSNEEGTSTDAGKFYRHRAHVLGDIVSSQAQFVGAPNKSYSDTGYADFVAAQSGRSAALYVGANDGMLHAFDVASGNENWAYIPGFALPRLYTLADKKYANKHQFFVEGTPKTADVYIGGNWKTILVGGMGAGGTGYFALDISNPAQPALLWEFSQANMGYSFGTPEITKLTDGTWVVLLTSGYNNCPRSSAANCATPGGDGQGHLYVLDAGTGAIIRDLSSGVGSSSNPSGLARILAQADGTNVSRRVYGGDLLGNLWRFDIQTSGSSSYTVQQIAQFKDPQGVAQPVTARPQVTTLNGNPVVYVGTGRYLGTTDVGNAQQQTFYAVKDNVASNGYTSIRSDSTFIGKSAVNGICPDGTPASVCDPGTQVRTLSLNAGTSATDSIATKNGWYVDFPSGSGELSFTDPKLVLGTLAFSTSVPVAPSSEACGGSDTNDLPAFAYVLDYLSGGAIGNTTVIASTLGSGIATAAQIAQLPSGNLVAKYRLSSGIEVDKQLPVNTSGVARSIKRIAWRELVKE